MISIMDEINIPYCLVCLLICADTGLSLLYLIPAMCSFNLCLKSLFVQYILKNKNYQLNFNFHIAEFSSQLT